MALTYDMHWLQSWHRNYLWPLGLLIAAKEDGRYAPYPPWQSNLAGKQKKGSPVRLPFSNLVLRND